MRRMVSRTKPRRKSRHWNGFFTKTKIIVSPRPIRGTLLQQFKFSIHLSSSRRTVIGLLHNGSSAWGESRPFPIRRRPQDACYSVLVLTEEATLEMVLPAHSRQRKGNIFSSFLSSFPFFFFSPFLFRLFRSSFFLVIYIKPQNKQTGLLGDEEEDDNNEWQLCDVDETKPVVSVVQGDLALEELTIKNSDEELAAVRSEFSAGNDVYVTLDFTVPDKEAKILSHRCEWVRAFQDFL